MGDWTTATRTWAVSEVLTATNMNAQLRDFANAFGAFTSYTPTITGFTLGNGTVAGRYTRVQKTVWFEAQFTFGTTSAAATAPVSFTLPVTAAATAVNGSLVAGIFQDTGTGYDRANPLLATTGRVDLYVHGTNGALTSPTTTSPHTWANTDVVYVAGIYQAA